MKINTIDPLQAGAPLSGNKPKAEPDATRFADILSKATEKNPTQQVGAVSSPPTLQPILRPLPLASQQEVYQSTEKMLNVMDDYQRLLGDQNINLRQMEPVVDRLKKEAVSLDATLQRMDEKHPITQLARDALLTASKEIARFDGGHYVPDDV